MTISATVDTNATTLNLYKCQSNYNSTGEYVLEHFLCDGKIDCLDGSDESNCSTFECNSQYGMFQCEDNSECISLSNYCDHRIDCSDSSDEHRCHYPSCSSDEYECHNGQCVQLTQLCDLSVDCFDNSDEEDCAFCATNVTFQCFDGTCISKGRQCDGIVDCPGI